MVKGLFMFEIFLLLCLIFFLIHWGFDLFDIVLIAVCIPVDIAIVTGTYKGFLLNKLLNNSCKILILRWVFEIFLFFLFWLNSFLIHFPIWKIFIIFPIFFFILDTLFVFLLTVVIELINKLKCKLK